MIYNFLEWPADIQNYVGKTDQWPSRDVVYIYIIYLSKTIIIH